MADTLLSFQMVTSSTPAGLSGSSATLAPCGSRLTATVDTTQSAADITQQASVMDDWANQQSWVDSMHPEAGCWPLATMLSYAVKLSYTSAENGAGCTDAVRSLEFLHYAQTVDILTQPTQGFGLARVADNAVVQQYSVQKLQSATCDGTSLLVVLPYSWSISSALTSFGLALGAVGVFFMLVTAAVVFKYRAHPVIRSASTPFLLLILLGLVLLCAAVMVWSVKPTDLSCSIFLWSANLGFMAVFAPLFIKTWRGQQTHCADGIAHSFGRLKISHSSPVAHVCLFFCYQCGASLPVIV